MNRTSSVSLQIAFFIFMIIGLSLFFGAYALIVPIIVAYIWGAISFGQWRIRQNRLSLEQARAQGLNRFGLPDLPRFYGFQTVLWWLVPPVLLLLLYRSIGTPILTGMIEGEALALMGKTINADQLHDFARSTLASLGLSGTGSTQGFTEAQRSALPGLADYFGQQHALRRLFWLALLMGALALWLAGPKKFVGNQGRTLLLMMAAVAILISILSGYGAASIVVLLILALTLFSVDVSTRFARILFMATGTGVLIYLRDQLAWGSGGWIVSMAIIAISSLILWRSGVRPRFSDQTFFLIFIGFALFILLTILTWVGAYSWLFDFGSVALFDISPGTLGLESQKLLNAIRDVRAGLVISDADMSAAASRMLAAQNAYRFGYIAVVILGVVVGVVGSLVFVRPVHRAQVRHEKSASLGMMLASAAAILVTIGIVLALLSNAELFFSKYPIQDFLFGLHWSKDAPIRDDQAGGFNLGAVPVFYGTLVVSLVALTVALPIGLMSAIYMAEYASPRTRGIFKPILEVLAGIPTIVYGVFALRSGIPFAKDLFNGIEWILELRFLPTPLQLEYLDLAIGAKSGVVAGAVMGIMLIPFISSLSDDALKAVPRSLRDGSLALGGHKSETILKVLIPAALPGIMGGFLLATSRAIGETMIVVLAAGGQANLTLNVLDQMTTVTVQITELLIGDAEFDRANTLSVFGLGLVLFISTLLLNLAAIQIVRRYRQRYS
ncbi:MAG: phosphate ABC transporter permease subunit PstC [Alphaproteobacteria bacterium]